MNFKTFFIIGIYEHTTEQIVGSHAIKIIGWGIENDVPYWLCVNSWGKRWGEKGLFRISRGSNECEIISNVITGKMEVE